jgi:hypothetical protein
MDPTRRAFSTDTFGADGRHRPAGEATIHRRHRQLVVSRNEGAASADDRPVTFHIDRPEQADRPHPFPAEGAPGGLLAPLRTSQPFAPESGRPGWLAIVAGFLSVGSDRRGLQLLSRAFHDAFAHLRGYTKEQVAHDRAVARTFAKKYSQCETQRAWRRVSTVEFQQSSPKTQLRALITVAQGRRADIDKKRNSINARMRKLRSLEEQKLTGSPLQRARSRLGLVLAEDPKALQRELDALARDDYDQDQLIRGTQMHLAQLRDELDRERHEAGRKTSAAELERWMRHRQIPPIKTEGVARELGDAYDAFLRCCNELQAKCHAGEQIGNLDALFALVPLSDEEKATFLSVVGDPVQLHTRIEQLKRVVLTGGMYRLAALELAAMNKAGQEKPASRKL